MRLAYVIRQDSLVNAIGEALHNLPDKVWQLPQEIPHRAVAAKLLIVLYKEGLLYLLDRG